MLNSFIANVADTSLPNGMWTIFIFVILALLFFVLIIGLLILKGYSLWTAARRGDSGWFVALLIVNTVGILELCYLYFVVEKWKKPNVPPSAPSQQ